MKSIWPKTWADPVLWEIVGKKLHSGCGFRLMKPLKTHPYQSHISATVTTHPQPMNHHCQMLRFMQYKRALYNNIRVWTGGHQLIRYHHTDLVWEPPINVGQYATLQHMKLASICINTSRMYSCQRLAEVALVRCKSVAKGATLVLD